MQYKSREITKEQLALINKWKELHALDELDENDIWDYVTAKKIHWHGYSDHLQIYTRVGVYTNKQGRKSAAHFSIYGKYLKSAKSIDEKPTLYTGWFQIKPDNFMIDLEGEIKTFTDIFVPVIYLKDEDLVRY